MNIIGIGIGSVQRINKIIVSDGFNRSNSNTTMSDADTGQAWLYYNGTWGISNNQAYMATYTGGTAQSSAVVDSGVSNCTITVGIPVISGEARVVFRLTDATNLFQLKAYSNNYTLRRFVAGSSTNIASYSTTPANGDRIVIALNGSQITVYINGTKAFTVSDSFNQSATCHGIGGYGTASERYDNFTVEVL